MRIIRIADVYECWKRAGDKSYYVECNGWRFTHVTVVEIELVRSYALALGRLVLSLVLTHLPFISEI
jgi:hypothetical protein